MNKGWECPKCGRCYAPWVSQCGACPGYTTLDGNSGQGQFIPCLVEDFFKNPANAGKMCGISCPCPKCTPQC